MEQNFKIVKLMDEQIVMILTSENKIQALMCTYEETNGQFEVKFRKISEFKSTIIPEDVQDFGFEIDEMLDKMSKEEMLEMCEQNPVVENSMAIEGNKRLLALDKFCANVWGLTDKMIKEVR